MSYEQAPQNRALQPVNTRVEGDIETMKGFAIRLAKFTDTLASHARGLGYLNEPISPGEKPASAQAVQLTLADAIREVDRQIERAYDVLGTFDV